MDDKEILAMSTVNEALKNLSEEERYRVIQWVANKYYSPAMPPVKVAGPPSGTSVPEIGQGNEKGSGAVIDTPTSSFATFAEMLDASGASSEADRLLVTAYWIQEVNGQDKWKSFEINKLLKDTGNQIETIGNPVRQLEKKKPKPIVQLSKVSAASGKGTKEFKLTSEGIKIVQAMLKAK